MLSSEPLAAWLMAKGKMTVHRLGLSWAKVQWCGFLVTGRLKFRTDT